MQCMIFAAGFGTRLQPLTNEKPKALIEVGGKTLLEILVEKLISQGFKSIIVNAHHFEEQIVKFFEIRKFDAYIVVVNESDAILDTGGGLKNALSLFQLGKPILLHNVDVLSNLDLGELYRYHIFTKADATLAVSDRETSRYLLFYENRLVGWRNTKTGEIKACNSFAEKAEALAFSGIQVINPNLGIQTNLKGKFSMIDLYLEQAAKCIIKPFIHNPSDWMDVGTPNAMKKAEDFLREKK